jgi:hypothetical protein
MRKTLRALLPLALLVAAPVTGQSVYNNGAPNGSAGWDIFNDYRAADDFTFTGTLAFDLIRFWGLLPTGFAYSPTMFWEILADGGAGSPSATSMASGLVAAQPTLRTSLGVLGFDSWQFDLSVGPQSLGPGIYWLALHDGPLGGITDSSLLWEMTGANTASQFQFQLLPTSEWSGPMGGDLAFELGTLQPQVTPEPLTITLLGTGLAGIAAARRRRRNSANRVKAQGDA